MLMGLLVLAIWFAVVIFVSEKVIPMLMDWSIGDKWDISETDDKK